MSGDGLNGNGFPAWKKYWDLALGTALIGFACWLLYHDANPDGVIGVTTGGISLVIGIGGGVFVSFKKTQEFVKLIRNKNGSSTG